LEEDLKHIFDLLRDIYKNKEDLEFKELKDTIDINDLFKENIDTIKDNLETFNDNIERVIVEGKGYESVNLSCNNNNKKYVRSYNQSISKERINITKKVNNYFIGHLTNSDLSILEDFDIIKVDLDIVSKSFVTLSRPMLIDGVNVFVRDTMLLAPGGKKSLDAIGKMYGNLEKIKIPIYYKDKMDKLLIEDPNLFKKYAMQDSMITLIHGCFMEVFYNKIGGIGIPLTLSGLSSNYIKRF